MLTLRNILIWVNFICLDLSIYLAYDTNSADDKFVLICTFQNIMYAPKMVKFNLLYTVKYTETIKLCPLDVYVCQFLMYERISFNFLHYKLIAFRNVMHLNEIYLITSRAADNSENTSTLKIKSHNINSLCVSIIIPNSSSTLKHH